MNTTISGFKSLTPRRSSLLRKKCITAENMPTNMHASKRQNRRYNRVEDYLVTMAPSYMDSNAPSTSCRAGWAKTTKEYEDFLAYKYSIQEKPFQPRCLWRLTRWDATNLPHLNTKLFGALLESLQCSCRSDSIQTAGAFKYRQTCR